jgi:hypothetical protein
MGLAVVRDTASPSRKQRHVDVREVIAELHRQRPRAGTDQLTEALAERLEEDRALLLDGCRVLLATIEPQRRRATTSPRERAARQVAERMEVTKIAAKVREIAVLDTIIDGKALRFHTGAEVARLGAGFARIAERVPADCLVGEILTSVEAEKLMSAPT